MNNDKLYRQHMYSAYINKHLQLCIHDPSNGLYNLCNNEPQRLFGSSPLTYLLFVCNYLPSLEDNSPVYFQLKKKMCQGSDLRILYCPSVVERVIVVPGGDHKNISSIVSSSYSI